LQSVSAHRRSCPRKLRSCARSFPSTAHTPVCLQRNPQWCLWPGAMGSAHTSEPGSPSQSTNGGLALKGIIIPSANLLPIHDIPPRLHVSRTAVLVLQVVRMLPHIARQYRDAPDAIDAVHQGVILIRRRCDRKLPVAVHDQPNPSRTRARHWRSRGLEPRHKFVD